MTLRLQDISKRFGPVVALNKVSFDVAPGEVHALLGENGAGKTTLTRIAFGMQRPDAGALELVDARGETTTIAGFSSPRDSRAAGIGMVHQHFTSIPAFTVGENIALAAGWRESGRAAELRAAQLIARLGLELTASEHVESLSVQLRQRLEIVQALASDARTLLLDEPTAALAPREVDELLAFVRAFVRDGGSVVLITHKLDEVLRVADRVTVLRRGEVTLNGSMTGQTPQSLATAMIGGELPRPLRTRAQARDVLVRASELVLERQGKGNEPLVIVSTLELRGGEVVGVAAIEGNGQRELLRAIAGIDDGRIIGGMLVVIGPVAFVPEDRTTEGLIPQFTLAENLQLGRASESRWWLDWNVIGAEARQLIEANDVRAEGADALAASLSGGNQQKFVLARALAGAPRVIVAEDPTRGLDINATQAIHEKLRAAAAGGAAVIVHSSDLDEVLALADRRFVVARGRVRELPLDTPRDAVGDAMLALEPAS